MSQSTDPEPAYRLHFKAQTLDRTTPSRVRVAWWIGPAFCDDSELIKIGEWEMDREAWNASRARVLHGYEGGAHFDGTEGGEWDWSKP